MQAKPKRRTKTPTNSLGVILSPPLTRRPSFPRRQRIAKVHHHSERQSLPADPFAVGPAALLSAAMRDLATIIDDRPGDGVFRLHRDAFADPEIFELEQKFIFARSWNFLTLESQLTAPHDFATSFIGRTPILVTRDAQGDLHGFVNVCRHKGALLCGAE